MEARDQQYEEKVERPYDSENAAAWQETAQEQLDKARKWVRSNPLPALGIALATGFVVGKVFRR